MASSHAAQSPTAVEAVRFEERHQHALDEFFLEAWSGKAPAIDPAAPTFGLLMHGRVVGYIGTLPVRFWDGAREEKGHWMKGFMVLPGERNSGIGYFVLKEAMRHLGAAGSLSVAPPAHRLFEAVGFRDLGLLSNQIALLRPARVFHCLDVGALGIKLPRPFATLVKFLQRCGIAYLFGVLLNVLLMGWRLLSRFDTYRYQLEFVRPRLSAINRLWSNVCTSINAGVVRDGAHFQRYREGYRFVTLREGALLRGIAVVRVPRREGDHRLKGVRVAVISDLLVDPRSPMAQRALLKGAEQMAYRMNADALLCSASYAPLQRLLRTQGYLSFPGNVHLLQRATKDLRPAHEWWLLRGDGNADEIF